MTKKIELYQRTLDDILSKRELNYIDPNEFLRIGSNAENVFKLNPFIRSKHDVVQILGIVDKTIVATVSFFPLQLIADEKVYNALAGSKLIVVKEYRKFEFGLILPDIYIDLSESKCTLSAGISKMALPILQYLDNIVFFTQRMIFLCKTKSVLEIKLSGISLCVASFITDIFLSVYKTLLKFVLFIRLYQVKIEKTNIISSEIEAIIKKDPHKFKENHTKEWFEWILNNTFSNDPRSKQSLYIIKKRDEIIGFFMTKIRFHEQASHRGFKNVMLGSVIEWGSKYPEILSEELICLCGILSFEQNTDAVEICTDNKKILKFLKRCGLRNVGTSNFAIRVRPESPISKISGYDKQENWRIRPASADNGLA